MYRHYVFFIYICYKHYIMADNQLHITVPIEMKQAVFKKCAKKYQSVSEYIRELIRKDLSNE